MTFKNLVASIESLPPLSDVAISIQRLFANGAYNVNTRELVKTIESDAILTANILKMINVPHYGLSYKISSISQAVALFGINTIYGVVLKYAINEHLRSDTGIYGLSGSSFNEMCHLQRNLILRWYSRINIRDAQFLAPLVLMMETGKLILEQEIKYSDYLQEYLSGLYQCEDIEEYEKELFETTSFYVSALLFEHWNLEPLYIDILKGIDFEQDGDFKMKEYENVLKVIKTAINVKEILSDKSIKKASEIVKKMGMDVSDFEEIAYRVKESYVAAKELEV
ncbi:HDOD domain-containing protein [Candidatus Sulfurimonas marisnigri]|uniref:HDOD domain-containing protein n=1 Tax=Candidatus Sulfurimonas marisnigri TaxID=2740405 RepID=A0A7S7LYA6_9BACT|nr:HDOD domain-containing protein [Candidatus Sulfurimonas marisnigri]QOY53679.1 HDOD domain-containing protein [Candidatus Sulfurimonas marisnigri]